MSGDSSNPTTGAVSTSCGVSFTPNAVAIHTITASYSGDTTHSISPATDGVRAPTVAGTKACDLTPASVPVGSATSCTATVTDATPGSASAPTGTVGFTNSGGTFSASSCTLGSASTNPTTGAVSTDRKSAVKGKVVALLPVRGWYMENDTDGKRFGEHGR